VTPVPPGGGASAQATARREERARKHASQSAFTTRPSGVSALDWFYPTAGVVGVLALFLIGLGVRPGPRPKLALLKQDDTGSRPQRRRRHHR
jgi:hypothetical protein